MSSAQQPTALRSAVPDRASAARRLFGWAVGCLGRCAVARVSTRVGARRRWVPVSGTAGEARAAAALAETGIAHRIQRHGPVSSLAEAARLRGVEPGAVVKSLVVRRGPQDHLFVLVPGGRQISWPKLRAALGVHRLSLPDAATAREVTGYERGTITPFGSLHAWPVLVDAAVQGQISIGAGGHGVSVLVETGDLVAALSARVVDVTVPAT